jgi:NAD(P)-dependent dehydrogenase (short-subunit alcohol dehydrogenase family)
LGLSRKSIGTIPRLHSSNLNNSIYLASSDSKPLLPNTMSATATYHKDTYPSISPILAHLSTTGKSALVTGAGAGGIGGAIATSLALSGISTIGLLGSSESRLLKTQKHLQQIAPKTLTQIYIADLTDRPAAQRAVTSFAATAPSGTIDILIANAGYLADLSSIEATEPAEWWKGFETNVLGNLNLLQAFLPLASQEKEKGDGKGAAIVHISTAAVHLPYLAGYSSYRASKIGATKLFEYVAAEHPELFVLQVHPGLILTTGVADKILENVKGFSGDEGKFECVLQLPI